MIAEMQMSYTKYLLQIIIMSPLCTQKGRHIGLLFTALFYVTSVFCVCVLFSPSIISPVLGYRVVFDATLNVGQRHKQH